jgi:hypothetical protein
MADVSVLEREGCRLLVVWIALYNDEGDVERLAAGLCAAL